MVKVGVAVEAMRLYELERGAGCVDLRDWGRGTEMRCAHAGDIDVGIASKLRGSQLDVAENVVTPGEEVLRNGS